MSGTRLSVSGEGKMLVQRHSPLLCQGEDGGGLGESVVSVKVAQKSLCRISTFSAAYELAEDVERVGEGGRAALDTILNIRCATYRGVYIHGARHAAYDGLLFRDSDYKLVWVRSQETYGPCTDGDTVGCSYSS
jgi:hypothetical protein